MQFNLFAHLLTKFENAMAKGENAHHELFLLLQQGFQKLSAADASESIYILEGVKLQVI